MPKPVILTVDDDAAVLRAIERDLRAKYGSEYRVIATGSPSEALSTARELAKRNAPVALFLVDQRMPGMTGIELLREAITLHPTSRRVLLTAYADTDVAITGINEIALDHYLMKPWDPPEQRLYPVLDDLLGEWKAHARPPFEGVRVLGAQHSPSSYEVREFLSRNQVPYQWVDVDAEPTARALAESLAGGLAKLPIVLFPDGTHLIAPTQVQLATKAGMQTKAQQPFYDVVIIGGGPAGLANAVYAASEGLRAVLVESHSAGGQAGSSSLIENYLGFPSGVTGADLAQRATAQARRFGAELLTGQAVVGIRRDDPYRIVMLADGAELRTYCVVITTGLQATLLEARGLGPLQGISVYYGAAMSEAARYRDQPVLIVGGANSAGQAALALSRTASKVTMLIRAPDLSPQMSRYLADRIRGIANIEVVSEVEVDEACGNGALESVTLKSVKSGETRSIPACAMFIFIGAKPRTDAFATLLERDENGFLYTGNDLPREHGRPRGWTLERPPFMFETNVPGVFAAGDVRVGANRRVAAAVGEGSAAIYSVHLYLRTV